MGFIGFLQGCILFNLGLLGIRRGCFGNGCICGKVSKGFSFKVSIRNLRSVLLGL